MRSVVIGSPALRAICAALALAAAYGTRVAAGYGAVSDHPTAAFLLWVASMALAALAVHAPREASAVSPTHRWTFVDAAIALAILGIALLLRVPALGERPVLGGDEAAWGVFARGILSQGGNPFGFGWYGWPALGEYVTAASLRVQGATVEALRTPSAVAGSLTAVLVYAYAARIAGRLAGTVAGLVAATLILHVHMSRQGLQNVFDGLLAVLALAALERAWFERQRDLFIVAGAALAIAQHFYASARVLPLIVMAWVALRAIAERHHAAERWRGVAAMAFVAGVASWPQVSLALADPANWLAPFTRVLPSHSPGPDAAAPGATAAAVLARTRDAVLGFFAIDMRGAFAPPMPLLPPLAAAAFACGLAALVLRWREPSSQLLALWIASVVAISALSESTPAGHRYLIGVPAVAIVAGLGAAALVRGAGRVGPRAATATAVLVVAALAAEGAMRAERHFLRSPPWVGSQRDVNGEIALDIVARIGAAPRGARVVMLGAPRLWYRGFPQFAYVRPSTDGRDVEAGEAAGPAVAAGCGVAPAAARPGGEPATDCLVAVLPHRESDLEAIRSAVTVVRETAVTAPDGLALYRLVEACGACGAPDTVVAAPPATSSTR